MQRNDEDIFTLQKSKLEIKYKNMKVETVNEIRAKVLSFMDSVDMRAYLAEHFKELDSADFINIIVGALKPITAKLKLLNELVALVLSKEANHLSRLISSKNIQKERGCQQRKKMTLCTRVEYVIGFLFSLT